MARVTLACKVVLAGLGLNLTNMERHVGIGMAGVGHVARCVGGMVPCHVGIGMAGLGDGLAGARVTEQDNSCQLYKDGSEDGLTVWRVEQVTGQVAPATSSSRVKGAAAMLGQRESRCRCSLCR